MRTKIASISIKDCEVQTFRAGGAGGQNQNKRDTGVRVIHHPSGARGESREERSQLQNKKRAFVRMCETKEFANWVRRLGAEDARVVAAVEREMWPDRIKVEVKRDGKWVEQ